MKWSQNKVNGQQKMYGFWQQVWLNSQTKLHQTLLCHGSGRSRQETIWRFQDEIGSEAAEEEMTAVLPQPPKCTCSTNIGEKNPCDVSWEATINENLKEEREHEFLKENKGKIYSAFRADCTEYKSTVQHLLPCSRAAWDANVAQDLCSAGAEMWQSQHWFALSLFGLEGWGRKCLQRTAVQKKNCALIKKLNLFLTLARSFVALASRRWK